MFRLSSKLLQLSRNQLLRKDVIENGVNQCLQRHAIVNRAASFSAPRQNLSAVEVAAAKTTGRVFAPYSIYKGKASLSATPISPTFAKLESGALRLDRRGVILLSFCPAVGDRKYDREKRQFFALSAMEVGSLISLGSKDSCEFFHDPSMQSSAAGQVRKSLSIKPQTDGSGYMISLNVVDNTLKTNDRFVVPVTTAEFAVLRTACSFALPHIMGWDQCTAQSPYDRVEKRPPLGPLTLDSEWDR